MKEVSHEITERAKHDSVIHNYLMLHEQGSITYQQLLENVDLYLSEDKQS
ncbi:hypothetical protein [Peribacillus asahii]|nr:hypothetical protein [Peribacillus asahii]USK61647.1 hypothetical protein LIT37_10180 [Peribacillus asahii]HWL22678.1 hypothetical protein [Ureibacillus sp.]